MSGWEFFQSLCMCDMAMVSTCILCLLIHITCSLGCVHSKLRLYNTCACARPGTYVPSSHPGASAGYHCAVLFTNTHVRVLTSSMT